MTFQRFALFSLVLAACAGSPDSEPEPPDCDGDGCSGAESRDELLMEMDGFSDPISNWLRQAVLDDGSVAGDYRDVLSGVGAELGCDEETQRSFMVLSNESFSPKTVFNRCVESPTKASEFFLLLPSLNSSHDIEPGLIHMVAWDDEADIYRRYATFPKEGGGMSINVQPGFCLNCHGGPRKLGTWQPLMNEMTNPWSQWNAEPGFRSHVFDEFMPDAPTGGAVFADVTASELLDSASNFEPIIRSGIDRVTGARMKTRHQSVNLESALELLQPLFCDEHVNFVSEIHGSGEIRSSVAVDDAIRELLQKEGHDQAFLAEDTLRVPEPAADEANLTLAAVRGESTLRAELALVNRQALQAIDVLQVRSLDWQKPVDSEFRCQLFEDGKTRIEAGDLDEAIAQLPSDASNADALPILLRELMTLHSGAESLYLGSSDDAVYSIPDASAVDLFANPPTSISTEEFADELQTHIETIQRSALEAERHRRACRARAQYITAPLFPDASCGS